MTREEWSFSFYELLLRIKTCKIAPSSWASFENLIEQLSREQDPYLTRQRNKYPDIILSDGTGIEAKMLTDRPNKSINLNSTYPGETYYICAFCTDRGIQQAAIIHGRNYSTPEKDKILKLQQTTQFAQNPSVKFRGRLMWEVESPFKVYGEGFYLVDHAGGLIMV
jgi:hypothetical protein